MSRIVYVSPSTHAARGDGAGCEPAAPAPSCCLAATLCWLRQCSLAQNLARQPRLLEPARLVPTLEAHATGDAMCAGASSLLAQTALARWWTLAAPPFETSVQLARATLLSDASGQHRPSDAEEAERSGIEVSCPVRAAGQASRPAAVDRLSLPLSLCCADADYAAAALALGALAAVNASCCSYRRHRGAGPAGGYGAIVQVCAAVPELPSDCAQGRGARA